jgi:hypothetical protein
VRIRRPGGEEASAVVIALALAAVMIIVMGTASGRVLSATSASAGALSREQARTLAEQHLMLALAELDVGGAADAVRRGVEVDRVMTREVEADDSTGWPGGSVSISVRALDPRQQFDVRVEAVVRGARHAASATVRPLLSVDHLMLSEYEAVDPVLQKRPRSHCSATRSDPRRAPDCIGTVIGPGALDGPVHSNDAIVLAPTTTSVAEFSTSHVTIGPDGSIGPALWGGPLGLGPDGAPFGLSHQSELTLPRDSRDVLAGATVTCRFRGPTLLRFDGSGVRVTSPRSVPREGESPSGPGGPAGPIGCLDIDRATLAGVVAVELPPVAVIEVVRDPVADCVDHPLGLVWGEDTERDWWCSDGDAFVWGRYRGARTIVAEDHVQIVWDLEPGGAPIPGAAGSEDLLGLVAGDSVVLRRPVGRPVRRVAPFGQNLAFAGAHVPPFGAFPSDAPNADATTWDTPRVVASLVALRGSIGIQNPFRGEPHPGPLRIEGSVASRFRGVMRWEERSSTGALIATMGYPVDLRYDLRLRTSSPPAMPLTGGGAIRIVVLDVG